MSSETLSSADSRLSLLKPLFLIFLTGLLVRLLFFLEVSSHPISGLEYVFKDSDMHGNLEWARSIPKDPLGYSPWHPSHPWMLRIAPLEQWLKWWGGKEIFQQSPLYAYLLSLLLSLTKDSLSLIRLLQMGIGSLTPLLLFFMSFRLFGLKPALWTGWLAALYFPFFCHEYFFLRDFLAIHLLCWILVFWQEAYSRKTLLYPFLLGILLGTGILLRENFVILVPFAWFLALSPLKSGKEKAQGIIILYSGLILMLLPLWIRNDAVGAPFFSLSNRLMDSLIEGNAFDSEVFRMCLPESMKHYLVEGNGNAWVTFKLLLKDYPDFWSLFKKGMEKIFWMLFWYEPYNNLNIYFFKEQFPWIRVLPDYPAILLPALSGLLISIKQRKHRRLILFAALLFISLLCAPILCRYRLIQIPFYLLWAGLGMDWLSSRIKNFPFKNIGLLSLLILVSVSLNSLIPDHLKKRDLEDYYCQQVERHWNMK